MVGKVIVELENVVIKAIEALRQYGFAEGVILPALKLKIADIYRKNVESLHNGKLIS